jgi:acyl-coenzyme A synthetase/AMP-(fatty) acid ligase
LRKVLYSASKEFIRNGGLVQSLLNQESPILVDPTSPILLSPTDFSQGNVNYSDTPSHKLPKAYDLSFATSGSSGIPKIIAKTQREINSEIAFLLLHLNQFYYSKIKKKPSDTLFLVSIPLCYIYGFLWGYVLPQKLGARAIDASSLSEIGKKLNGFPVDIWITVPSQLEAILKFFDPKIHQTKPSLIVSSGSRLNTVTARKIQELFSCEIWEIYGSTETGGIGLRLPTESETIEIFPVIKPKLIDRTLAIASPFIHPELLDENGFFTTEDLGELNENRFLYLGRKDRMIKVHEKRIHLDLVEKELKSTGLFEDAMAIGYNDQDGTKIGALLVLKKSITLPFSLPDANSWRMIPKFLVPNEWIIVEKLPSLRNGKKDYESAREKFNSK